MFKIYKNRKTNHPSISIKQRNRRYWWNMPITHSKPTKDTSLEIDDPHPKAKTGSKTYVRRYIRKDKRKVKGHPYREYILSKKPEMIIKKYLKRKHKKR